MLRHGYAMAATLAAPALRLWLARRARSGRERPARLPERRGIDASPRPPGRLVWLHAVSVGETASVLPLLPWLAADGGHVLLTTGTVNAAALLEARLPLLGLDGRVLHRFAPWDVPAWAARFLDHWRPDAAGFVESEIWPNLLAACAAREVPALLVNARLSARSFSRWRRFGRAGRDVFAGFRAAHAQSDADAGRLRALGVADVGLVGNLKFAADPLPVDAAELARFAALVADRPVWLAACTHPGEEAVVLDAHARLRPDFPGLLTVLVPRHPHRGAELLRLAPDATRRALGQAPPGGEGVWIGDTLGEMGLYYRLAGHAFIGGSLVPLGGQNPLEAARLGCALAAGPHVANQREAVALLTAAGALATVQDAAGLAAWSAAMLRDPAAREAAGRAGAAVASRAAELPEAVARMLLGIR